MTKRVDPNTLLCRAHGVQGCSPCMVEDFQDWWAEQRTKRGRLKRERTDELIEEKFDLGGEG